MSAGDGFEKLPELEETSDGCAYTLAMAAEEVDAIDWLMRTLQTVHANGGQNASRARLAHNLVVKLVEHGLALHCQLHKAEERIGELEIATADRLLPTEVN